MSKMAIIALSEAHKDAGVVPSDCAHVTAGDAQGTYLLDNLESWESFAGQNGKNVRIFPVPPRLTSIPVRPFMLDAALTGIQQPKLDHRVKKAEKASTFSRIFGWR